METIILNRGGVGYPQELEQMHIKPTKLYVRGTDLSNLMSRPRVAIVGSRRMSAYGQQITTQWARQLAEQGVVIISGLASGVDAQAHWSALEVDGLTIAVLPGPVENPMPTSNQRLAREILAKGGALVSTYPAGSGSHKGNFVARNEVVAALSDVVLITEATANSGTRHTADFAENMKAAVYAVPGSLQSPLSEGCNRIIAAGKAHLAPDIHAIFQALQLKTNLTLPFRQGDTPEEQAIIDIINSGVQEGSELLAQSELPVHVYNQTLTMLEISGKIMPLGSNRWGLA